MLQRLDPTEPALQALILVPTRELAQQVSLVVQTIGDYMSVRCHAFIGGNRLTEDLDILKRGVHVAVGTPGRILDLVQRNAMNFRKLRVFVFDEADEMLSVGFEDHIKQIIKAVPIESQVGIFSATMPPSILDITREIVRKPVEIIVKKEELTLQGIRQFYVDVKRDEWKLDTLCDLYDQVSINQSVIFCRSKNVVDWLTEKMTDKGFPVASTHSEKEDRNKVMAQFKNGSCRVLICTDLMARGIDVQQVSVVINYDLPVNLETYIHRIGRSGRFGRKGVAINFITSKSKRYQDDIQKYYNTTIEEKPANIADYIS